MPCFANSPSATRTWQRPQMARPPQTESMSTPSVRAAASSGVPTANRPRLPDGVKTTSGSGRLTKPRSGRRNRSTAVTAFAAPTRGRSRARGSRRGGARSWCLTEPADPARAVRVVTHHDVRRHARADDVPVQGVRDCGRKARRDRHREEGAVDAVAVWQSEAHIRCPTGRVDLELFPEAPHEAHDLDAGLVDRADRHDERIDDDVAGRDSVIHRAMHDLACDLEANVRILGNARLVVRYRDDGRTVLLDERQDGFEAILLAGDRVHEGLALVHGEPGGERGDDR